MSLLPGQILPQTVPLATMNEDGQIVIEKEWWLFLYNLFLSSGINSLSPSALIELAQIDSDADDTDATVLRQPISNILKQLSDSPQVATSDLPDIYQALLLAQDGLLPDSPAQAQPAATITPSGSPFTFTAPFNGQVSVTAGTVSQIQIVRQGTTVATGLIVGLIALSQGDQLIVTYSVAPTMAFLPT